MMWLDVCSGLVETIVVEETEKKDEPSLKSKITGLFKKSSAHSDYPTSEEYSGPLDNTARAQNIDDIPLSHEVAAYPTEFSYEKLPEHAIPVVVEETEKKDEPSLKSKITGLFKKSSAHSDYPTSEEYSGPLDNTARAQNIDDIPLSHEVAAYPTEFSYEKLPEHAIPVVVEETEKKDEPSLKSKITGLFKKSSAHSDYPTSEEYSGPLDNTARAQNIDDIPLSHEVAAYPTEFSYEKLPEHVIPVVVEETEKKDEPSLKSKITGLFKKSSAHSDYPTSEEYSGPLDNTARAQNIDDIPLSHEVAAYPTEFSYEKLPEHVVPVVVEETEKKDEPSLKSKITGLFKKSSAHSDYPTSEEYSGPLENTARAQNIDDIPLSHEVAAYPTEFSYEKLPEHVVPVVVEETEKKDEPSLKSKITGLFKKSSAHSDYPTSEEYSGPLDNTARAQNIDDIPLSHEVAAYPTEFSYEKLPEHVVPVVIEETEKKDEPSLKSKITGLFKKSSAHSDYPTSEEYSGPLDNTACAQNIDDIPLSHEVAAYPTEFSYEKLPEHVVPVVVEETEKKDEPSLKSKITGLFKKSSAHSDYPTSEEYSGPLDNTARAQNIDDIPLSHEVAAYPTEFSYEKLPEHVVPVVVEETEKKDEPSLKSKITGLFKKSSAHSDYPTSEEYSGPLENTARAQNVDDTLLGHEVTAYSTEFSYEKLPEHVVPVVVEETEKKDEPSLKSKITGLFKKSSAHSDYPTSEEYSDPLDNTARAQNIDDIPLSHEVAAYPTEFSYEKLPEHAIPVVVEETEKKDEPSLKSKITGLFKKSPSHLDYPISDEYSGPLDNTARAQNIDDIPLSHEVAAYPTEFSYEKLPEHAIPVVVEETEKKDEPSLKSKITGLFKKSPSHLDYPISDEYSGPLDNTARAQNIDGIPLSHEVAAYPTEFSYEKHLDIASNEVLSDSVNSNDLPPESTTKVALLEFKSTGLFENFDTDQNRRAYTILSDINESRPETDLSDSLPTSSSVRGYNENQYDHPNSYLYGSQKKWAVTKNYDRNSSSDHLVHETIDEESNKDSKKRYMWSKYETETSKLTRIGGDSETEFSKILDASDYSKLIHSDSGNEVSLFLQANPEARMDSSDASTLKRPDFDVSFKIIPQETPKEEPLGFSVSISARSPLPPLMIDESPQLLSVENLIHSHTSPQQRRLSPHTWTTVRETTEVSYIKRVTVTSSTDYGSRQAKLRRDHSPIQAIARQVHSFPSTSASHQAASTTCRWTTFDDPALNVHHPIYPPSQSLYKSTPKTERAAYISNGETTNYQLRSNGNGTACHNGNGKSYGEVREIHAHDRTEVVRDDDHRRHRREDVFTVGTPFVIGRVEADARGNEYLRYNPNEDLPMIEDGAMECRRSTVRARLREMDEVRLVGEREEIERQRRPIRRARQRVRNICTML
uniref:Uncharacterized protein n=2 Tax=Caenorhabditis japonica TaxID=281687 RepID=A0A8R1DIX9_CAEJA